MMRLLLAGLCSIFIALTSSQTGHDSEVAERSLQALEFPNISIAKTFVECVSEIPSFSQSDLNDLSQLEKRDVHFEDSTTHHVQKEKRSVIPHYKITIGDAPDLCDGVPIDTITVTKDKSCYIFKGAFYWKMEGDNGITSGYPKMIWEDWDGLPDDIDASFTWPSGETFFFKGKWCWRFFGMQADDGYPKRISQDFPGVPDYPDAAIVLYGEVNRVYFFKGEDYWLYDSVSRRVLYGYPKKIVYDWRGLPSYFDAAVRWSNDRSYFFKDGLYYKIMVSGRRLDPAVLSDGSRYPLPTGKEWFGCGAMS